MHVVDGLGMAVLAGLVIGAVTSLGRRAQRARERRQKGELIARLAADMRDVAARDTGAHGTGQGSARGW